MYPQQPYNYQQPPAQQPYPQALQAAPYGQNPYQQYGYPPQYQPMPGQYPGASVGTAKPSGITAITAACLGCLITLGCLGLLVATVVSAGFPHRTQGILILAGMVLFSLLPIPGAIGLLARKTFGRWILVIALALTTLVGGYLTFVAAANSAPIWALLFSVSLLAFSLAGLVLASAPTTGTYLAAAAAERACRMPAYPTPYAQYGQQPYAGYPARPPQQPGQWY